MENSVYILLKGFFRSWDFCPDLFGHLEKWVDKKAEPNFKISDVTGKRAINGSTHIAQYLNK